MTDRWIKLPPAKVARLSGGTVGRTLLLGFICRFGVAAANEHEAAKILNPYCNELSSLVTDEA